MDAKWIGVAGILACGATGGAIACTAGTATDGSFAEVSPYGGGYDAGPFKGSGGGFEGDAGFGPNPFPPQYGTTTTLADSPPPIYGGTLLVLADGTHAVAADPDRDLIYVVDLIAAKVTTIALAHGDGPFRVAEDGQGDAFVTLRSGALAVIDVVSGALIAKPHVCSSPRGLAFDGAGSRIVIACDSGDVIAVPVTAPGSLFVTGTKTLASLDEGLRDVLVDATSIYVSRYRTAEMITLDLEGKLVATTRPAINGADISQTVLLDHSEPTLAWRMLPAPPTSKSTAPVLVHQYSRLSAISPTPHGYGGNSGNPFDAGVPIDDCVNPSTIVRTTISQGNTIGIGASNIVLPVDAVWYGDSYYVVSAANARTLGFSQIGKLTPGTCTRETPTFGSTIKGQLVAIAVSGNDLIVQSREPAQLQNLTTGKIIPLSSISREDTGHAIFHSNSGGNISCASCHGEGGDDAHVWTFEGQGERRTPSLRGTLAGTAPYHWDGAMTDISMLVDNVLTGRMSGPALNATQKNALQTWLFALPPPSVAPIMRSARGNLEHGRSLFQSSAVGCASCHSGPRFTNSATVDVGTGGSFQVPSLIGVRARTPLLHNGCAKTLRDRFGSCATPQHGATSSLGPTDVDDLVTYLESL